MKGKEFLIIVQKSFDARTYMQLSSLLVEDTLILFLKEIDEFLNIEGKNLKK